MDLFEILKQFKMITPDEAFTEKSKRAVLASSPLKKPGIMGVFQAQHLIFRIVETGAALALAGLFVVLITGGFFGLTISPVRLSAIDPKTLRAEAQIVDAQINLAELNYSEPALVAESTQKLATAIKQGSNIVSSSSVTNASSTSSSTVSIDQALEALSK